MAEAEKALQRKAEAGISSDWEAAAASANLGGPIATHRPKSKIVKDVHNLVERLASQPARRETGGAQGRQGGVVGRFSQAKPDAAPAPRAAEPAVAPQPAPKQSSQHTKPGKSSQLDMHSRLHSRLIDELDLAKLDKLPEHELRQEVMQLVADFARGERMALNSAELQELGSSIYDEMMGLGPIEPLLKDESINDILINGPFQVYVERRGELELTEVRFRDNNHLLRIVNRIVGRRRPPGSTKASRWSMRAWPTAAG